MAFSTGKWVTTVTLCDTAGKRYIKEFENFDTSYQYAEQVARTAIVVFLAQVTKLKIVQYQVALVRVEESLVLPTSVYGGRTLSLSLPIKGNATKRAAIHIPEPADTLFMGTSGSRYETINWNSGQLLNYLNLFDATYCYLADGERIDRKDMRGKVVTKKTRKR